MLNQNLLNIVVTIFYMCSCEHENATPIRITT
jgi:hypothetical protein